MSNKVSPTTSRISRRGFASMSPEKQRAIASKGGRAAHEKGTAHEFTRAEASEAGKKGGCAVHLRRGKAHMSAIGKIGGQAVSRDRQHMSIIGQRGGIAVSRDRQHMAEIGVTGGEAKATNSAMATA